MGGGVIERNKWMGSREGERVQREACEAAASMGLLNRLNYMK